MAEAATQAIRGEREKGEKKLSRGKCGKLLCLEMENFTTVQRMRCAYQLSHRSEQAKESVGKRRRRERERERGAEREGSWATLVALACKRKNLESFLQIYLFIYLFSFSSLQAIHFSIYHARDWGKIKVIVAVRRKLEELQE